MISQTVTNDIPLFWPHQLVQSCGNHEDELLRPLSMEGWQSEDSNIVPLCLLSCMYPGCVSHGYSQPVWTWWGSWHGVTWDSPTSRCWPQDTPLAGWSHLRPDLKSETFLLHKGQTCPCEGFPHLPWLSLFFLLWRALPSINSLQGLVLTGYLLLERTS